MYVNCVKRLCHRGLKNATFIEQQAGVRTFSRFPVYLQGLSLSRIPHVTSVPEQYVPCAESAI